MKNLKVYSSDKKIVKWKQNFVLYFVLKALYSSIDHDCRKFANSVESQKNVKVFFNENTYLPVELKHLGSAEFLNMLSS